MRRAACMSLCVLLCAAPVYVPALASAQFDVGSTNAVTLTISPEHPGPGDSVQVAAHSSDFDLGGATLAWYVDGKLAKSGVGLSTIAVTAGALGSEMQVSAVVAENGQSATADASIRPTELELLWESDSYVPPFYRGRALPSAGTSMRLEAMPRFILPGQTTQIPPNDIVFTWRRNQTVLGSVSGRGKSAAVINSPQLFGADTISVDAATPDGLLSASASFYVPSTEPIIDLYQDHPLFGILYGRALGTSASIPETEVSLVAVPYFAQALNPDDGRLTFAWRVNGIPVAISPSHQSEVTLNATNSNGLALVEIALTSASNFFLSSYGSWAVSLSGSGGVDATNPFQSGLPSQTSL